MSQSIWFTDVETGGVEHDKYSILSVALIEWNAGKQFITYEAFIKEDPIIVDVEAMQINQIDLTDKTIAWKSTERVAQEIQSIVPFKSTLGGHNTSFDSDFLKRLFRLGGQKYPFAYRKVDVPSDARLLVEAGKLKNLCAFGMLDLCAYFGIEPEGYHTAMGDVLTTIKIYEKLLEVVRG